MLIEIVFELIGEATFGRLNRSQKAQVLIRVFFGFLGVFLGLAGAYHFIAAVEVSNRAMHASMVALFVFIALFSLFNVAFKRRWRWPGLGIVVSFVSLFATRVVFGP